jgi:hypothetical protein
MSRFILIVSLVSIAGCKKEPPATSATPKPAEPTVAVTEPVKTSPGQAAPADPAPATKPAPKDLPAFKPTSDAAARKQAIELANLALGAQTGRNEEDPLAKAIAAVKADPGSALARYAIACVAGDEAFDLAQLTPLTTATGCTDCADIVRNLAMSDWDDCGWSANVKALAAKVTPSAQRTAAEALIKSLQEGDAKHAAAYFTAPSVEIAVACSVCDGKQGDTKTKAAGAKQLGKLVDQVKKAQAEDGLDGIVISGGLACTNNCCEVDVGQLQHNHDFFEKVCFKPGTDQVQRIELVSGG